MNINFHKLFPRDINRANVELKLQHKQANL